MCKRVGGNPRLFKGRPFRAGEGLGGLPTWRSVKTTMIYTHVLNRGGQGVQSPVDTLCPVAAYTTGAFP